MASKLTQKQENFCQQYLDCLNVEEASKLSDLELGDKAGNRYYVYFLVDPRNEKIFYIGKGKGDRVYSHQKLLASDVNNCKKAAIADIKKSGESVKHVFFCTEMNENDAFSLEGELIKRFKSHGLTNISLGVVSAYDNMIAAAKELRANMVYCSLAKHVPPIHDIDSIESEFGSIDGYYSYVLTALDWVIYGKPNNPEFKGMKATLEDIIENARIKNQNKSSLIESLENV